MRPLIDPNYWQEPEDLRRGIMGMRIARDILRQPALKPFLAGERIPGPGVNTDKELFEHLCLNAKTQHHPVGTCKMGTDEMAVVAPDLKVHGHRWASRLRLLHHAADQLLQHQRAHHHDRRTRRRHHQGQPDQRGYQP